MSKQLQDAPKQEETENNKLVTIKCSDVTILGQTLGKGAYGEVYTVKYRGDTYAAKEIHKILQEGAQSVVEKRTLKDKFVAECSQCYELSHPNIVRVIGIYYKSQLQDALPVMLMEMMDESLTVYVERLPNSIVERKGPILLDVAEGLIYLHNHSIIHRDLSPNNIMLVKAAGEMTTAKIGDLGVAKAINPNSKSMQNMGKLTKIPGTLDFMPPEAFEDAPEYDTSLDVFSYGAVMLFVATHAWPSPGPATRRDPVSHTLVALNEVQRRQKYLDKMTDEMEVLKPLVEDCLSHDPNKRPTMLRVSEKLKSLKLEGKLPFMMPPSDGCAPDKGNISAGTVRNEIYSLDTQFSSDHDNEDERIVHSNKYSLCMCVFDGHDGLQAVQFAKKYIEQQVLSKQEWDIITSSDKREKIEAALANHIQETDDNFFKSIDNLICEKQRLQSEISKEVNNSQPQQIPPRLQKLESLISGGCTAVVAVLTSDRLYVANIGDSRAILACKENDGSLQVKQLSVDHDVDNEQELERLTALGLDREQLKKSGKLGTQKSTRSIGDYMLKGGYKDVDVLSHATDQPGIAVPHVTSVAINHYTFKYLILMSSGVYRTLELIGDDMIVDIIEKYIAENGWNEAVAINILQEIRQTQYKLYHKSAGEDIHSPVAVANRKRDDMTLVIYKFDTAV